METKHVERPPSTYGRGRGVALRGRRYLLAASAALCAAIFLCYRCQPDWLAALTLVPAWFWLVPGFVLAAFGFRRQQRIWAFAVLLLWLAFAAVQVEEVQSVCRGICGPAAQWEAAQRQGRGIRVVSLNCAAANRLAAAEVAQWEPDIVLLQESPSSEHLSDLSRELFGDDGTFLWGGDTSILARGRLEPHGVDLRSHFVHATVELPTGVKAEVLSVRFSPPVVRLDFWTLAFWRDHRNNRIKHRRQILDVVKRIEANPQSTPLIVGGDFNAPAGDAALAPLQPRLYDTFGRAGRGWGDTGTNGLPLFRVDQVWASPHFRAESVTAQKTVHSDHRMVVCDVILE